MIVKARVSRNLGVDNKEIRVDYSIKTSLEDTFNNVAASKIKALDKFHLVYGDSAALTEEIKHRIKIKWLDKAYSKDETFIYIENELQEIVNQRLMYLKKPDEKLDNGKRVSSLIRSLNSKIFSGRKLQRSVI